MNMTRRDFLKLSGLTLAGTAFSPLPLLAADGDKVLVVVSLLGGNDGLNTVVPLDQYDRYRALRPRIGLPREGLLELAGVPDLAFNPQMNALHGLYGEGKVALLNGVALPPDARGLFDHSASQYAYATADVDSGGSQITPTGWAGRLLDTITPGLIPPGIDMGGGSLLVTGEQHQPMAINSVDAFKYNGWMDWAERQAAYERILEVTYSDPRLEMHRTLRREARALSDIVQAHAAGYVPAVEYPDSNLADSLQECAKLITADMGARVLSVATGGYDHHSNQQGNHNYLLGLLSDALVAFYRDLAGQGHSTRVVTLVVTEFGRRAYENSDDGTDHGYSSPAFVVGDSVFGDVYGDHPRLEEELLFNGNTDVSIDFRSVYATLLTGLFGIDPAPVLGGDFAQLGFI